MSVLKSMRSIFVPINRCGYIFVFLSALITIVASVAAGYFAPAWLLPWVLFPLLILTAWVVYFFRDPPRVVPVRDGLIISPADGKISHIVEIVPPAELGLGSDKKIRVSIFMNVFDCHVNRAPIAGTIQKMVYTPGKFFNAELDKASEFNERNGVVLKTNFGEIGVVQIAGLVARRIVWWVKETQSLKVGERFGMIRFGSRVDVFLPLTTKPLVFIGQKAVAGETVLADLTANDNSRTSETI